MKQKPLSLYLALLGVVLALSLSGCGTRPVQSAAPIIPPADPASAATIVMYRVKLGPSSDALFNHKLYINGAIVGRLNDSEEVSIKVDPGRYVVSVQSIFVPLQMSRGDPEPLLVVAKEASTHYVRYRTIAGSIAIIGTAVSSSRSNSLEEVAESDYLQKR